MARRKLCPYCEKPLPAGDEARELHRIRHALESIETVLTDLVDTITHGYLGRPHPVNAHAAKLTDLVGKVGK